MSKDKKLIIGLTGGIGSGKSLVARQFEDLGIVVIDADQISREIVLPHSPLLKRIEHKFGPTVLNSDGSLDRTKLQKIIFQDEKSKQWLEQLLHPVVCEIMIDRATKATSPYCVLVIPLLIELLIQGKELLDPAVKPQDDDRQNQPPYQLDQFIDRILIVNTDQETQIKRVQDRNHLPTDEIIKIIHSQTSQSERLAYANDVIDNTKDISYLKKQVLTLHNQYLLESDQTEI